MAGRRIEINDGVHISADIEDQARSDRLAGDACPRAASDHGELLAALDGAAVRVLHYRRDVPLVQWQHDASRGNSENARRRAIHCPREAVEQQIAADQGPQVIGDLLRSVCNGGHGVSLSFNRRMLPVHQIF